MGISTSTGTLAAGESRAFSLTPANAVTLTTRPNCRVTIIESPDGISASGVGGNVTRMHDLRLPGEVTYGPYLMGGTVIVGNESNSGSSVTWVETRAIQSIDTAPESLLKSFFASGSITNRTIYLEAATYTMTSLLAVAMTNVQIIGVPGITKITGAFGYGVLKLLDCTDVEFYGIIFETTYTNAVEDTGNGCLYSYQNSMTNVAFRRCKFTAPNANTNGFSVYPRINGSDESASEDNLLFEDCEFSDCGRMGVIVLNRFTGADRDEFAKRITFMRCKFKDLGLNETYGIAISLDGFGRKVTVEDCEFENCYGIGIENTGYNGCTFIDNQFKDFQSGRLWSPMSFSTQGGVKISGNRIIGNRCIEACNQRSNFIGVDDSLFEGNYWSGTGAAAFQMRDAMRNKITRDRFVSDGSNAVLVGNTSATTSLNEFKDCIFDNATYSAGASSTLLFDGSATTANKVIGGNVIRGSSGSYITETNSATWEGRGVAQAGQYYGGYRILSMSDANYTLTEFNAQSEKLRFSGTLTAGRTVFFPRVERNYLIRNSTGQTLTLSIAGITTTIADGAYRFISWQELSGGWVDWGGLA